MSRDENRVTAQHHEPQGAGTSPAAFPEPAPEGATTVTVEYFASFRDERGVGAEQVQTIARTLGELYRELSDAHNLRYDPAGVRVARNDEFASWEDTVSEGDRVVFLAPFGGG